jgi:ABC-type nitrate/sulfonate/bicarbonate transport system substrate-binding protein
MAAMISRRAALIALAASLALLNAPAEGADKLRVGKSVLQNFGYIPLDIGMKHGIFEKNGIEVENIVFAGGARLVQGLVAGSVDIGLGGGPDLAYTAKGSPHLAVGTIVNSPSFMGIAVASESPLRRIDDLKGKKVSVTSHGSLTYWLVEELNRAKGWTAEKDKAMPVVIGGNPAATYAALRAGQVDAALGGVAVGYQLQEQNQGRLLLPTSEYVKDIVLFATLARTPFLKENPDAVRRFLKAWYEAVDFMRNNKAATVAITIEVIGYTPGVMDRVYDQLMPTFSTDGKFPHAALDKLRASMIDLGTIDASVDMSKLYTEEFLPKR